MKKRFTDYLREVETKTKPQVDVGLDDVLNDKPTYSPAANNSSDQKVSQRRASPAKTRQATAVAPSGEMADMMSRIRDIDVGDEQDMSPDEFYNTQYQTSETPPETTTLPATVENMPDVVAAEMQTAGYQYPEFHQVSQLPGNMRAAVRVIGKELFGALTSTPTDDIWVAANVAGQGPNSREEMQAIFGYLRDHGEEVTSGEIDFDEFIPGYRADIQQYSAADIRWLTVKDDFGYYVYTWPESDSAEIRSPQSIEEL